MSIDYEPYLQQIADGVTAHKRSYEPFEREGLNFHVYRYWWDDDPKVIGTIIHREGTYQGVTYDQVECIYHNLTEGTYSAFASLSKITAVIADARITYPNSEYRWREDPEDPDSQQKLALFYSIYNDKFVTP